MNEVNAGTLSDGRIFLVWNGVPRPHVNDSVACGSRLTAFRNPLTLALSSNGAPSNILSFSVRHNPTHLAPGLAHVFVKCGAGGADFDRIFALYNSTVPKRYCGSAKPFGPSYPQAREVAGEGLELDGLWAAYSINKEDIGITFAPRSTLYPPQ